MKTLKQVGQIILHGPDGTTVEGCRANVYLCVATVGLCAIGAAVVWDGWSWAFALVGLWAAADATRFYRKAKRISAGQSTTKPAPR